MKRSSKAVPNGRVRHRIIFIGGETKQLPLERLQMADRLGLLKWEHKTGKKKTKLQFGASSIPSVAFVFADFVSHNVLETVTAKLKALHVDVVKGTGGFNNLLRIAEKKGHHELVKIFENGGPVKPEKKEEPKKKSLDLRPSGEAPMIKVATIDGLDFRIRKVKGKLNLIVRGEVLEELLKYADANQLRGGVRGGISLTEAKDLAEYLETKYGFGEYGIDINPKSLQKNLNHSRGALTPKAAAAVTRKGKKARAKAKNQRKGELARELTLDPESAKVKGGALEVFLAEISQTMKGLVDLNTQHDRLYEKILDLEENNRLLQIENDQLREELKRTSEDRDRWKEMANAD